MPLSRIIVCQHALAEPDGERPITADGARETRAVAAFLKASGLQYGPVFHSGVLRARQTAEILAGADSAYQLEQLQAKSEPAEALRAVSEACSDARERFVPLLVSHMPFVGRFVAFLVNGDASREVVKCVNSGAIVLAAVDGGGWRVEAFLPPSLLPAA
eukprot:tig00000076_g2350.t1